MELKRALFIVQDESVLLQLLKEALGNRGNLVILEQYLNLLTWNHQIVQILGMGKYPDLSRVIFPNGYVLEVNNHWLRFVGDPAKRDKKRRGKAVKRTLEQIRKGGKNGTMGHISLDGAEGREVQGQLERGTGEPTGGNRDEGGTGVEPGHDDADQRGEDSSGEAPDAAGDIPLVGS